MAEVATVRTDDLAPTDVRTSRRLLDDAFEGRFEETDWDHACGGLHVLVRRSGTVVAHGAVVPRTLRIGDDDYVVGYVEAVATAPRLQGRGLGSQVMIALAAVIETRYDVGVLSTGGWAFYERLGWRRWQGPSFVRRSNGRVVRTPDEDDGIMVLAADGVIDLTAPITCRERPGDDW